MEAKVDALSTKMNSLALAAGTPRKVTSQTQRMPQPTRRLGKKKAAEAFWKSKRSEDQQMPVMPACLNACTGISKDSTSGMKGLAPLHASCAIQRQSGDEYQQLRQHSISPRD